MKKKTLFTMIAAVTFAGMLTGCGGIEETAEGVAGKSSARTEEEAAEGETREKEDDSPLGNKVTESVDSGADSPAVYMTSDISSDGLIAVYEALQISPEGRVAVKLSTGKQLSPDRSDRGSGTVLWQSDDRGVQYGIRRFTRQYGDALSGGGRPRLYRDRRCGYHG